ncbi:hypothetical protein AFL01nite_18040 [Aeromicrobium flavum]|uniref:GH16 domain-containing protein n=2 Tax=Aeromicrobium flavum TaxID=416568 RepID=A0A512HVK3_9ACTN|nr:hypothetical protein AFL01nite_18040 [Aeromicrobium flavum]
MMMALALVTGMALGGLGGLDGGPQPAAAQDEVSLGDARWKQQFVDHFEAGSYKYVGNDLVAVNGTTEKVRWRNGIAQEGNPKALGYLDMNQCVEVRNGVLFVKPRNKFVDANEDQWRCRITTTDTFGGGPLKFSAKVKLHSENGRRSSFWWNGYSGNTAAEIDVIENEGRKNNPDGCQPKEAVTTTGNGYYGLNHSYYSAYEPVTTGHKHCLGKSKSDGLLNDQFHTVEAVLTPGVSVQFFIDGQLSARFGKEKAQAWDVRAILTNIKLGDGTPNDFEVEWVKVWNLDSGAGTVPPPPAPDPVPVCDNDCERAKLGVYTGYNYVPNSNPSSPLQARIVFDRKFYLGAYPDVQAWAEGKVATQGGNINDHAQWHWLNYGIPQGRMGSATFDPYFYLHHHPDVAGAYGATNYEGAIRHYVQFGRFEGRRASVLFDPGHYKARYGDMAGASNEAVTDHFTVFGMDEGRQGSADFGPAYYLANNPDVRAAFGKNYRKGMSHWIAYGRGEGRKGAP